MKAKLIMISEYPVIVLDELPSDQEGYWTYIGFDEKIKIDGCNHPLGWFSKVHDKDNYKKVIAGFGALPTIDFNGFEEQFGHINLEKLIQDHYQDVWSDDDLENVHNNFISFTKEDFVAGFRASQSLNEKKFNLDDLKEAIDLYRNLGLNLDKTLEENIDNLKDKIIDILSRPKIFEIEIEIGNESIKIIDHIKP